MGKQIIAVTGPPCSGKTTLAKALAKLLNSLHLDLDELARQKLPNSPWNDHTRDLAYSLMHQGALEILQSAGRVVLSATYGRLEKRDALIQTAVEAQAAILLVQCKVSVQVALDRFHRRAEGHAAVDLDDERVRSLTEAFVYWEGGLIIDTNRPLSECIAQIEKTFLAADYADYADWEH